MRKYLPCIGSVTWWLAFVALGFISIIHDEKARAKCRAAGKAPMLIHAGAWSCGPFVEKHELSVPGHDITLH